MHFSLNWILMILAGFVVLVIIAVVIYLLIKAVSTTDTSRPAPPSDPQPPASGTALDILNQRYARGEINHEEYLRIKAEILDR